MEQLGGRLAGELLVVLREQRAELLGQLVQFRDRLLEKLVAGARLLADVGELLPREEIRVARLDLSRAEASGEAAVLPPHLRIEKRDDRQFRQLLQCSLQFGEARRDGDGAVPALLMSHRSHSTVRNPGAGWTRPGSLPPLLYACGFVVVVVVVGVVGGCCGCGAGVAFLRCVKLLSRLTSSTCGTRS